MLIHKDPNFSIYFGDATDMINKKEHCIPSTAPLFLQKPFNKISRTMPLQELIFLDQVHSAQGMIIPGPTHSFAHQGDYLITQKIGYGIGILTADCLPLMIYDAVSKSVAAIHVGWRGAFSGIIEAAVYDLIKIGNTCSADLSFFLGPSAQECCYTVGPDFIGVTQEYSGKAEAIIRRNNAYFYSLAHHVIAQLQSLGIKKAAINQNYNFCTICDKQFFSYRRLKNDQRQMSVISLI